MPVPVPLLLRVLFWILVRILGQVQAGQQLPPDVFVLFALVVDGATGVEGDRVPLVQQVLQVVLVPNQALFHNVNTVDFRPYLPHLCPA